MVPEDTQPKLPDWINNDFFERCLQKENDNKTIVVTKFNISTVVPPGNNYGSFIIRAKVDYKNRNTDLESHTISLIVKSEQTEGPLKDITTDFNKQEPFFYYSFLTKAKKFNETFFASKCFFSPMPNVTILEDLKEKGFLMADRMKQLDFDHCRLYMTAAASMHATSVAVFKHHPEMLEPIKEPIMYTDSGPARDMCVLLINKGMKIFISEVEKLEQYKKYKELLTKTVPNLWKMLVEVHKPCKGINTIRQGDPWTTNMMFKYDKRGSVSDIKLIDFQAINYGAPAADITFFIWTSANNDVKRNRLEELYRIYVDTFNAKLQQCKCDDNRLSYQQFVTDMNQFSPEALFLAAAMTPLMIHPVPMDFAVLLSQKSDEETERFFGDYYDDNFSNNYLPHVMECLEVNGVFEFFQNYEG